MKNKLNRGYNIIQKNFANIFRFKWKKRKKPKCDPEAGHFFNATTQEEFDSLAYAAKTIDIIENGEESPLFVYLALLTKVYPDGTDQKKNLVQRRLQKVCFHFSSGDS